jgi:hypothetical protein
MSTRGESRSGLEGRVESFAHAHVTFERMTDVTDYCPQCGGLLTRRLGPGVLCACCGRLWVIRELLGQEAG